VLNVAGAVNFVFFIWMFFSPSLAWLPFFFMSLTAFSIAAIIKRKSVPAPAGDSASGQGSEGTATRGGRALGAASLPPAPMFDRQGRTPLERVMRDDDEDEK
jgi:hypothetical protein